MLPLSVFSKLCTFFLGWEGVNLHRIRHEKRVILVFPHSSFWDAPLGVIFRYTFLENRNVKLLLWHKYYDGPQSELCKKIGFIPVYEKGGLVNQVVDHLNKLDKFVFCISPEGGVRKQPKFKSGFYQIAKQTNSKIAIVNLDFLQQKAFCYGPWPILDTFPKEVKRLKKIFAIHPPLNPDDTDYAAHFSMIKHWLQPFKTERLFMLVVIIMIMCLSQHEFKGVMKSCSKSLAYKYGTGYLAH